MTQKRPSGTPSRAATDHRAYGIEPMYLEAEVAEMLRVRLKVIQRERYAGRLGFVRVGAQVRIRHSDVQRYLDRQSQGGAPAASTAPHNAPPVALIPRVADAFGSAPDASQRRSAAPELRAARRGREIARSCRKPERP